MGLEQLARMQKRRKGSPSITSTTRRKGLVAKRRLSSRAAIEGSETNPERKGNKGLFNLDKRDTTPSPRQLVHLQEIMSEKAPESEHLVYLVSSNLPSNLFSLE